VGTRYFIGVDGSGPSRAALRWGLHRAAEDGSPVVLVHVVDDEWGLVGHDYAEDAERQADALLAEEAANAGALAAGVEIRTRVLHGSPWWELAGLPDAEDLLIIGTHKTGFLRGRVLGSRSVQVASAARSSVAIVPDAVIEARRGVVVGVDRFDGSIPAVARGAREALRLGQELLLVHAPPTPPRAQGAAELPASTEAAQQVLVNAAAAATAAAPGVTVHRRLVRRAPAEALLDTSYDAALLVLGVSHPRQGAQSLIGSVTHDVLMNINVPVLIARGGGS
jgi:nucleotide-binding universal stress UspA family protein